MKLFLPLAFLAFFVASCDSKNSSSDQTETTSTTEVTAEDHHSTSNAVTAYMELKEALVSSDAESSVTAANRLSSELLALDQNNTIIQAISVASDSLANTNDLEIQRTAFSIISDNMFIYLKENGHGRDIYLQKCPMAFQNQGAYWLAEEEDIMNPYMPETMLKCGRVEERLEL